MEFTITAGELAAALNHAKGIAKPSTIPIIAHVLLTAKGDKVRITANNLQQMISLSVPADVIAEGETTLPAQSFLGLIKAMPKDAEVRVKTDDAKGKIHTSCGRSKYQLPTLPAGDFPVFNFDDAGAVSFSMAPHELAAAIEVTRPCVSTEETRYYLGGVCVTPENKSLAFVATDGHRLSRLTMDPPDGAHNVSASIVPAIAATGIVQLCKSSEAAAGDADITLTGSKIRVELGSVTFASKLIEGTFPDYQRVIPRANGVTFRIAAAGLSEVLERIDNVLETEGYKVAIKTNGEAIEIRTGKSLNGEAGSETVDAEILSKIEIGVNARYLAQAVGFFPAKANLEFWAHDPSSPILITSPEAPGLTQVIMPQRI